MKLKRRKNTVRKMEKKLKNREERRIGKPTIKLTP